MAFRFKYKTNIRDIIGHDDELAMKYSAAMQNKNNPVVIKPIVIKRVKKDDENK